MADYYTHFSEAIEQLSKKEIKWLHSVLTDGPAKRRFLKQARLSDEDVFPDFRWSLEQSEPYWRLWVRTDESGNFDHLAVVVQAFLAKFRPDSCFLLTWAETCSRPRLGAFGGGGMFVTAQGAEFMNAHSFVEAHRQAFMRKAERAAKKKPAAKRQKKERS